MCDRTNSKADFYIYDKNTMEAKPVSAEDAKKKAPVRGRGHKGIEILAFTIAVE